MQQGRRGTFPRSSLIRCSHRICLGFTRLNLRGIETSARVNQWMAAADGSRDRDLLSGPDDTYLSQRTVTAEDLRGRSYDLRTFSLMRLSGRDLDRGLTYIGFDGISTLSEEAENPRRNILLATVLICLVTGILPPWKCTPVN